MLARDAEGGGTRCLLYECKGNRALCMVIRYKMNVDAVTTVVFSCQHAQQLTKS
jgi:hypothetical protein